MKNKTCSIFLKTITVLFILAFAKTGHAQVWVKDSIPNSLSMDHLFYSDVKGFFIGGDSVTYVVTEHRPDSYWDKEIDRSELLLSKIDGPNIKFIKKLDFFIRDPLIKVFNKKYYLFDKNYKIRKKKYYYTCYVYDRNWALDKIIEIQELPAQKGFKDLVVDTNGNLYFTSNPYYVNYKAKGFVGNYLVKVSANGEMIKHVLFKGFIPKELTISNDTLQLSLIRQKEEDNFLYNDSSVTIMADTGLNYSVLHSEKFIRKDDDFKNQVTLADNDKVIMYDSTIKMTPTSSYSVFKIGLNNGNGQRNWTIEPNNRWFYRRPKALKNGGFITQIDKRWDSTCVVIFDKSGNQRSVRSFLMNADTRIIRYHIIDFFEMDENEIVLFYNKEYPTRKEEIFFERIKL